MHLNLTSIIDLIKTKCQAAIFELYPSISLDLIEISATSEINANYFGDYQCNSALKFAKILKKSPISIAEDIVKHLNASDVNVAMFSNITVAAPGFINFSLSPEFLQENLKSLVLTDRFTWEKFSEIKSQPSSKVIVDFSSPNIAKEMHVGHLRSTIIGDCIARILEFVGYEVLRLNHLGDWGTQFGMLIAYLKNNHQLQTELELATLVEYYKNAKKLFDYDPGFKQQAQQEVVALQAKDPQSLVIWQKICKISLLAYQQIYSILDINIIDRGESFYNPMLPEIIADFAANNLLVNSQGAKCVYLENFKGREQELLPLIIQKSDGAYNYATTDLAAIKHRVQVEQADWIIYVTDNGQSLHFSMVFAAANKVGYLKENTKLSHVPFGLVLRADGKKFKTREGDTVRLQDLIDNAILTAKKLLVERSPEISDLELQQAATIMGINAIKYADLSHHRNSDYVFDSEKMLQFTGNTAAFLSYAYVRINSIKNKLEVDNINSWVNLVEFKSFTHIERKLSLRVCKFKEVLASTIEELLPHRLTDYLYLLAEDFHVFFHECKVIGSEFQDSRLLLCLAVAKIIEQGFNLLGLKIIDKM